MKINKQLSFKILSVFIVVFMFAIGTYIGAYAYTKPYFGRTAYRGYFYNVKDTLADNDNVLSGSPAIPDSVNSVATLIQLLKDKNTSGVNQNITGSSFIVNTMLGRDAPGVKAIYTADWQELTDLLSQPSITIDWNVYADNAPGYVSSYYQGPGAIKSDDVAFYDVYPYSHQTGQAIIIRQNSKIVYSLFRKCANPMGVIDSIIKYPLNWNITTDTSVNKASVTPGNTITWTHTVTNNVNSTNKAVVYSYEKSNADTGTVGLGTLPSGSPVGATIKTSSYTPVAGDVGKTFCRNTIATPKSDIDNGTARSNPACATVVAVPSTDPCRPIQITVTPNIYSGNTVTKTGLNVGESRYVHTYTYPAYTPPVEVISVNQTTGARTTLQAGGASSWSVIKILNTTSFHTTGDPYGITFHETTNHVVGVSEYMKTISVYGYVTRYRGPVCRGQGKNRSCSMVPYQSWEVVRTYQAYNYSQINYSDGQTTTFTYNGGSMPITFNGNGTNYSWMMPANSNGVNGVGPCYDYSLSPSINAMGSKREPGETISITPTIASSSYTQANFASFWNTYKTQTHSKNTNWQITMMRVAPNVSMPSYKTGAVTTTAPCNYFDPSNVSTCTSIASGSTVFNTSGNPSSSVNYSYTVPDIAAGTKVCFAFSIKPNQSDPLYYTANWNNSEPWSHTSFDPANNCIIVVKKPKVQIWGGDLATGGSAQTSTTIKSGNIFGSWVEYAIFARGSITGTASGSAFYSPSGSGVASSIDYNKLSFSNVCNNGAAGCYGNYVAARTIPDVAASFVGGTALAGSSVNVSSLNSGTYTATSDVDLEPSTLPAGKSVIIKALNGTVYINGDQVYANGPYKKVSDLPQLIIIANRIVIRSNVTNVDAWLVGINSVETCDNIGKTINLCNVKLTVNGPVMTNKLQLYRTAGSGVGNQSGDPAEVFNLRADAYLWAANRSMGNGSAQTVMTTDVPPRN